MFGWSSAIALIWVGRRVYTTEIDGNLEMRPISHGVSTRKHPQEITETHRSHNQPRGNSHMERKESENLTKRERKLLLLIHEEISYHHCNVRAVSVAR